MLVKNRIDCCFIHLVDFENSKEWYKNIFGFDVKVEGEGFLEFDLDGPPLILLQAQVEKITPLPYSVFFFETMDVEKTQQTLKEKGAKVGDIENFGGSMRGCHFYDPEGNMLLACTSKE
ncbi:VOC family protein [Ornithinibacillus salinisoli]|uniref:VOC family protein n=1 Tax=Ornithinibacillus salinisoli TaxID=1848459 RepID=A0ABW4W008_9BACI